MSEKLLHLFVNKTKATALDSVEVTRHCLASARDRGIDVQQALDYFLNSECEWNFSEEKGEEGKRIEVLKRLSKRRGLFGVFEANGKVYLITLFKVNTRKQQYSGVRISREDLP